MAVMPWIVSRCSLYTFSKEALLKRRMELYNETCVMVSVIL